MKTRFGSIELILLLIVFILFQLQLLPLSLFAQELQLHFHHLSQDDGLSQGTNAYVMEDSRGFIWISSMNGLNRFDGKTVKTYLPNPEDSLALAGGIINSIFFEDRNGDIWFSSNVAIQRYVRKKDHFETIRLYDQRDSLIRADIVAFHLDAHQNLWLRVGLDSLGRLHLYNTINRKDSILYPLDGQRWSVLTDSTGEVSTVVASMFTEDWGFEIINHRNGSSKRFLMKTSKDSLLTNNIYIQDQRNIWFGSSKGLLHFDTETHQYRLFDKFQNEPLSRIWQVIPWKDKLIVSSGRRGILVFDLKSESFTQEFGEQFGEPGSLRQNNAYELYLDKHDILWVSLYGIGLDYASLHKVKFKSPLPTGQQNSIYSLIEVPSGEIWCTTIEGILAFTHDHEFITNPFTIIGWDEARHRRWIPRLFKDQNQRIWMSIYTDLFKYDDGAFHLRATLKDPPHGIITLSNGRTLVSTNVGMFEMIDSLSDIVIKEPREFERYGQISFETMYEDASRRLYISKNSQSLLIFQSEHDSLRLLDEISGIGDSNAFLERPGSDSLLICTEIGVIQFDPKTRGYRLLLETLDGLPVETYYSLIPDASGKIWLSGNKGIVRYDPVYKEHKRYTRADGMHSLEFNKNTSFRSASGEIWFGGKNGIDVFDPLNITQIPFFPQIYITNIFVNDEPYIMDTYIGEMTQLSFDYKHNTLSFEFAGLEFSDPKAIQYKYRMVSLDEDWVKSGTRNFARYPNLPAGNYQFEIIAANSDGVWNTEPKVLKISILPPFTQTIWFYLLLILTGGTLAYMVYRYQLKRKLEIAEKKRLHELDELKNRLYANITHEFRTPLTLIHGPVAEALSTDKPLERKELRVIHHQSERLQHLIDQILSLQKVEAGKLQPHYIHGDAILFIRYLVDSFELTAKSRGITVVYQATPDKVLMDYDEDMLTQIVSNLISNALKYTPRNGKISVTVNTSQSGEVLHLRVQDTGSGIMPEDLPYIFDRYYQSARAAAGGTGIGLALTKSLVELLGGTVSAESVLNFGSTFQVSLPITTNSQRTSTATQKPVVIAESIEDADLFASVGDSLSDKPQILIVEDRAEVLEYIASCLNKDFTVMMATDGNDGLRKAFENIPDLIITDLIMPGKDGFELCAALKTDIQTSHIPIIMLTGRRDKEALMEGIEHGADAYLVKPFNPPELLLRVKKLLELRANLRQYYRDFATSEDRSLPIQPSAKENAFLKSVRSIVEEHMSDSQFNTQFLCEKMAISHSQLNRKLTALTGESIGKLVRSLRLKKAEDLLKNSDLTISEVAYETGFSEPGYFTKVFSGEYQMTPSEYRSRLQ